MCLVIDKHYHQKSQVRSYIPSSRIAQRDIVVWKVLQKTSTDKYCSPYEKMPYEFEQVYSAVMSVGSFVVHQGLHSCRRLSYARFVKNCNRQYRRIFYAVIPKGAKLYFGNTDDVVSNKLIVYKTKEALEAVHGPIAEPVPRDRIAK